LTGLRRLERFSPHMRTHSWRQYWWSWRGFRGGPECV